MMMKRIYALTLLIASAFLFGNAPRADAARDNAETCTHYFTPFERKFSIPRKLLHAIAVTESGKWDSVNQSHEPWPWTINAQGKGYYFDSKEQAVAAVMKLSAQGVGSIDIGCMQVNLFYHGHAFRNIAQMFDPVYNVAYASKFLAENYSETSDWGKAVAYYHSRNSEHGRPYAGRVLRSWERIGVSYDKSAVSQIKSMASARGGGGGSSRARARQNSNMIIYQNTSTEIAQIN